MLLADRQQKILDILKEQESIRTSELSEIFNTSRQTINSDITHLDKLGKLKKVYGGATRSQSSKPLSIHYRKDSYLKEKNIIGKFASSYVEEGDSIYLDIGTTVRAMLPYLKEFTDLTIITNGAGIATELASETQFDIILIGGFMRNNELATSGSLANEIAKNYYVDKAFIGIGGITIESGITDYHLDETELKKILLKNAKLKFALFDSSKIGINALVKIADLDFLDYLISCDITDKDFLRELDDRNIKYKNLKPQSN